MTPINSPSRAHNQNGSTLIVALILMLVVTLLAVSSVKEATLEARMTGAMLEQQVLTNYAEACLRVGESKMISPEKPLEPVQTCSDSTDYCFKNEEVLCAKADAQETSDNIKTCLSNSKYTVIWYATKAPSSTPEDGNVLLGRDTFSYQITAKATSKDTQHFIKLCSVTSKPFTN